MSELGPSRAQALRRALIISLAALAAVAVYALLLPLGVNELARRAAAIFLLARVFWATEVLPTYATALCVNALEVLFLAHDGGIAGSLPARSAWLLAAAALTAMGVLDKDDINRLDWNVLVLMWGGLSLGQAMQSTALLDQVGQLPIAHLGGFSQAAVIALLTVTIGTFMSNTATANMLVPVAMGLAPERAAELAMVTAYACSFSVALPVSTPSNAMVFASGRVTVRDMVKAGAVMQFVALALLLLGYRQAIRWIVR